MLKVFQDINVVMERTGEFGPASAAGGGKEDLLKMVTPRLSLRDLLGRPFFPFL